tara:strand:+ start:10182 stop:11465 length:1284 start_codon:yes stop_codon:yes gene_type:complete
MLPMQPVREPKIEGDLMPGAPDVFGGSLKSDWQGTQIIYVAGEGYKIIIDLGSYSYALDVPDNITLKDISNYYDNRPDPKLTDREEIAARAELGIPEYSIDDFNSGFLNDDTLVSVPVGIFEIKGDAFEIANNFLDAVEENRNTVTSTLLNDDEYVNNLASYYIASDGNMQVAINNFKKTDLYGQILDRLNVTQAQLNQERLEFTDPEQFKKNLTTYTDLYNRTALKVYGSQLPSDVVYYLADQTRRGYFTQNEALLQMSGIFDPYANVTLDSGLLNVLEGKTVATTTQGENEVQALLDKYLPAELHNYNIAEIAGKIRNNALYKDKFINELKDKRYSAYGMYDRNLDWASIVASKKANALNVMGVQLKDDDSLLRQMIQLNDYGKEQELMRTIGLERGYKKVKSDLTKAMMATFGSGVISSRSYVG